MQGLRESDMAGRVKIVRDIPLNVDSANLQTLGQLKENIPNISDFIAEDTIYGERAYQAKIEQYLATEQGNLEFGLD
jgi:hypothetical protein